MDIERRICSSFNHRTNTTIYTCISLSSLTSSSFCDIVWQFDDGIKPNEMNNATFVGKIHVFCCTIWCCIKIVCWCASLLACQRFVRADWLRSHKSVFRSHPNGASANVSRHIFFCLEYLDKFMLYMNECGLAIAINMEIWLMLIICHMTFEILHSISLCHQCYSPFLINYYDYYHHYHSHGKFNSYGHDFGHDSFRYVRTHNRIYK